MITTQHNQYDEPIVAFGAVPCPTCWIGPADHASAAVGRFTGEYGYDVAPANCPTCQVASTEWGLVEAMKRTLAELLGMARVEEAVAALG